VLVDPDVVESSNLNRLVGATPGDARRARAKVHVMRRLVRQLNRSAQARALAMPLNDLRAVTALKGVDMLFGCTDNHSSRLILNHLAVQYLVPCLDLGTGLQAQENNRLTAAGGQVRLVQPGGACLACMDGFDRVQARDDLLPAVARQRQAARGYVQDSDLPTPAVLFLNNAVAALAVAEFVNLWTGYRTATPLLYFDLLNSRLTVAEAERRTSCIACGRGASLALGDLEPLPATETGEVPLSVPGPVQNCQPAYS
jgi:molybdopterin/thiamine biosynthesis adenylyltransferase